MRSSSQSNRRAAADAAGVNAHGINTGITLELAKPLGQANTGTRTTINHLFVKEKK